MQHLVGLIKNIPGGRNYSKIISKCVNRKTLDSRKLIKQRTKYAVEYNNTEWVSLQEAISSVPERTYTASIAKAPPHISIKIT